MSTAELARHHGFNDVADILENKPRSYQIDKVKTARGQRYVHTFRPGEDFWALNKAGKLPASVTKHKNRHSGKWEASIWGASKEEVEKEIERLKDQGIELSLLDAEEDDVWELLDLEARR